MQDDLLICLEDMSCHCFMPVSLIAFPPKAKNNHFLYQLQSSQMYPYQKIFIKYVNIYMYFLFYF